MKEYLKDVKAIWQWIYTVPEESQNCLPEKTLILLYSLKLLKWKSTSDWISLSD